DPGLAAGLGMCQKYSLVKSGIREGLPCHEGRHVHIGTNRKTTQIAVRLQQVSDRVETLLPPQPGQRPRSQETSHKVDLRRKSQLRMSGQHALHKTGSRSTHPYDKYRRATHRSVAKVPDRRWGDSNWLRKLFIRLFQV